MFSFCATDFKTKNIHYFIFLFFLSFFLLERSNQVITFVFSPRGDSIKCVLAKTQYEWIEMLFDFRLVLSNYPIGTAFNYRGEKQFRHDYCLSDKAPSRQEHLNCLFVHQSLLNILVILTIPWPRSAYLCSYFPLSRFNFNNHQRKPTALENKPRNSFRLHPNTGFRWALSVLSPWVWLSLLYKARISQHGGPLLLLFWASMWKRFRKQEDMVVGVHGFYVCQQKPKSTSTISNPN